jgi:hypothetical protein
VRCSILLLALLAASCQRGSPFQAVYPVKGRVLVAGKPAAGVTVLFNPVDESAQIYVKPKGRTDDDGWFTLTTYKSKDGAPAGTYAVTLYWLPKDYRGPIESANQLPAHYLEPQASGITAKVAAAANELQPFELQEKGAEND